MKALSRVLALLAAAAPVVACSVLLNTSAEQCTTDADCAHFGGSLRCVSRTCVASTLTDGQTPVDAPADATPADPVWGCLGNVVAPPAQKPKVQVKVPMVDLITRFPVTEVHAKVCAKIDVNCTTPLSSAVPDANGVLTLTLDAGFDGFVRIEPNLPDAGCPIEAGADAAVCFGPLVMQSLVFFNPPLTDDLTYITIPMLSPDTLATLANANGDTVDPSLGAVFVEAVDCSFKAGKDVSVSLDSTNAQTRGFYLIGSIPSLTATATDGSGYAGFINTPIGVRTVTGVRKADQKFVGKISVYARPGFISYTTVAPSQP